MSTPSATRGPAKRTSTPARFDPAREARRGVAGEPPQIGEGDDRKVAVDGRVETDAADIAGRGERAFKVIEVRQQRLAGFEAAAGHQAHGAAAVAFVEEHGRGGAALSFDGEADDLVAQVRGDVEGLLGSGGALLEIDRLSGEHAAVGRDGAHRRPPRRAGRRADQPQGQAGAVGGGRQHGHRALFRRIEIDGERPHGSESGDEAFGVRRVAVGDAVAEPDRFGGFHRRQGGLEGARKGGAVRRPRPRFERLEGGHRIGGEARGADVEAGSGAARRRRRGGGGDEDGAALEPRGLDQSFAQREAAFPSRAGGPAVVDNQRQRSFGLRAERGVEERARRREDDQRGDQEPQEQQPGGGVRRRFLDLAQAEEQARSGEGQTPRRRGVDAQQPPDDGKRGERRQYPRRGEGEAAEAQHGLPAAFSKRADRAR